MSRNNKILPPKKNRSPSPHPNDDQTEKNPQYPHKSPGKTGFCGGRKGHVRFFNHHILCNCRSGYRLRGHSGFVPHFQDQFFCGVYGGEFFQIPPRFFGFMRGLSGTALRHPCILLLHCGHRQEGIRPCITGIQFQ